MKIPGCAFLIKSVKCSCEIRKLYANFCSKIRNVSNSMYGAFVKIRVQTSAPKIKSEKGRKIDREIWIDRDISKARWLCYNIVSKE